MLNYQRVTINSDFFERDLTISESEILPSTRVILHRIFIGNDI